MVCREAETQSCRNRTLGACRRSVQHWQSVQEGQTLPCLFSDHGASYNRSNRLSTNFPTFSVWLTASFCTLLGLRFVFFFLFYAISVVCAATPYSRHCNQWPLCKPEDPQSPVKEKCNNSKPDKSDRENADHTLLMPLLMQVSKTQSPLSSTAAGRLVSHLFRGTASNFFAAHPQLLKADGVVVIGCNCGFGNFVSLDSLPRSMLIPPRFAVIRGGGRGH